LEYLGYQASVRLVENKEIIKYDVKKLRERWKRSREANRELAPQVKNLTEQRRGREETPSPTRNEWRHRFMRKLLLTEDAAHDATNHQLY